MWGKLFRYQHLHQVNPDKYPVFRIPVEWSEFRSDTRDLIQGFFIDNDCVLWHLWHFFLDNPIIVFLLGFGCAFGAFRLAEKAFKVSKI